MEEREYLKEFNKNDTKYVWLQLEIRSKVNTDWFGEVFYNFLDVLIGRVKLVFGDKDEEGYVMNLTEQEPVLVTGNMAGGDKKAVSAKAASDTIKHFNLKQRAQLFLITWLLQGNWLFSKKGYFSKC